MKILEGKDGKTKIKISKKDWEAIGEKKGWNKKSQNDQVELRSKLYNVLLNKIIPEVFELEKHSIDAVKNAIDEDVDNFAYIVSDKITKLPEYIEETKMLNGEYS